MASKSTDSLPLRFHPTLTDRAPTGRYVDIYRMTVMSTIAIAKYPIAWEGTSLFIEAPQALRGSCSEAHLLLRHLGPSSPYFPSTTALCRMVIQVNEPQPRCSLAIARVTIVWLCFSHTATGFGFADPHQLCGSVTTYPVASLKKVYNPRTVSTVCPVLLPPPPQHRPMSALL